MYYCIIITLDCSRFTEIGCFTKDIINSLSLSPNSFPTGRGCVCFAGSASCRAFGHTRPASLPGLSGAAALTPLGATPKARMLWLLAKSFARCKTSRASNAKRPFLIMIEVFRQSAGGASPSPTNMSHYIRHFSFNGDTQTVTLKSTIKTDILFPAFFIFPIDKSPVSVYTVYITHKQFNYLLCDVSLRI